MQADDEYTIGFNTFGDDIYASYFGGYRPSAGPSNICGGIYAYGDRVYVCGGTHTSQDFPLAFPPGSYQQDYNSGTHSLTKPDAYIAQIQTSPLVVQRDEIKPESESILIYPNPGNGQFNYEFQTDASVVDYLEIRDLQGRLLIHTDSPGVLGSVNLSNFPSGVFILNFVTDERIYSAKIVKQ